MTETEWLRYLNPWEMLAFIMAAVASALRTTAEPWLQARRRGPSWSGAGWCRRCGRRGGGAAGGVADQFMGGEIDVTGAAGESGCST